MSPWKRRALVLGAVIAAFVVGRLTAPPDVREVERERVAYKDRIVEKVVHAKVQGAERRVVVYRDRVVQPDGTRVEREVERSEEAVRTVSTVRTDTRREATEREATEREAARALPLPSWRVGALVGGQLRFESAPLLMPSYGAIVERRIAGPISTGAWMLTNGTFGLTLTVEF